MRADRVDMRSGRDPVLINYRFERRSGCDNQIRIAYSVLIRVHRLDWKRKLRLHLTREFFGVFEAPGDNSSVFDRTHTGERHEMRSCLHARADQRQTVSVFASE